MKTEETIDLLDSVPVKELFARLYGSDKVCENIARYKDVVYKFKDTYKDEDIELFSAPGRTEIGGNHTDHNHGKVLAASIDLDCIGAAGVNGTDQVNIVSETFGQSFCVDLDDLKPSERMAGTIDLVKGILKGFTEAGFKIGGFDAYITSSVISAAGVSSSAAFEMLICSILNEFFNDGRLSMVDYAHMGQYAENHYWNKASGLLDQMACAVGGLISIDFKDPDEPAVEKIDFDFQSQGYSLIIVNTGKGHADLSEEYSSIPEEMKKVAGYFGKEVCADITEEEVIDNLAAVRAYAGDRAVLRALHFFEENKRVDEEVRALKEDDFDKFLQLITASGNSSWKWLQNCYNINDVKEQGVTIALALTEIFLENKKCGACRVHGGGFAGVIMAMIPDDIAGEYISYMEKSMGEGNVYRMGIRPYGAVSLNGILSSN